MMHQNFEIALKRSSFSNYFKILAWIEFWPILFTAGEFIQTFIIEDFNDVLYKIENASNMFRSWVKFNNKKLNSEKENLVNFSYSI